MNSHGRARDDARSIGTRQRPLGSIVPAAGVRPMSTTSITGRLLRFGDSRKVAIYTRDGAGWVADFTNHGVDIVDATTWFRTCGDLALSHSLRKKALDSAIAIPLEVALQIESLHRDAAKPVHEPFEVSDTAFGEARWRQALKATLADWLNKRSRYRRNSIS